MNGGSGGTGTSPFGRSTAAGEAPGAGRRRIVAVAFGAAGVWLAGSLALRPDDRDPAGTSGSQAAASVSASRPAYMVAPLSTLPFFGPPSAAAAPTLQVPAVAGGAAPVRLDAAAAPSVAAPRGLSIHLLAGGDGLLDVDGIDVDRRQAIDALARVTGTRLHGMASLPRSLGRVTLQAAGVDRGTAWQRLLDGAALGFATACDRRACSVWFAPSAAAGGPDAGSAGGPVGAVAGGPPGAQTVEPTEAQN